MSAGEASWIDHASIESHQGVVRPIVVAKKEQDLPYFVMRDQPCQIQSLLGEGMSL